MLPTMLQFDIAEDELGDDESLLYNGTSYLYDFKKGDFIYERGNPVKVEGKEALKVWIEKALRTRINTYKIYDNTGSSSLSSQREYGSSIWKMIRGQKLPPLLIQAETKRDIEETLLRNDKILGIENYHIAQGTRRDSSLLEIKFTVRTVDEVFPMEVNI